MFACLDDEGHLYVAESSGGDLYAGLQQQTGECRVLRLEDTDDDGCFEHSKVFQDGVNFPMGIAWHAGRLYLADPPDLIALTDVDRDGRADRRDVILSGFGHTDNGSLHGLIFGPDGRLYFTMGTPDGWQLRRADGSLLTGTAGALFRCQPDGSRVEIVSRGFVNLVEVEFLAGGEVVGTDNWYQEPVGGLRDALVDCAPGGLFPYAAEQGTPLPRTGIQLPPLALLPAVAHSGVVRLRGPGVPSDWLDSLIVAEHNTRRVVRYVLSPRGATFAAASLELVTADDPDFHPSDVLEDMEGSLLIVDTGSWYVEHCPTGRIRASRAAGGIWRVRWNQAPPIAGRSQRLDWPAIAVGDVQRLLRESRAVIADQAAAELVRRGDTAVLVREFQAGETPNARLRALWSLARSTGEAPLVALREALRDDDPTIVTAAARGLALREDRQSGDMLAARLTSTNPLVRRAAAEALSICGASAHLAALVAALDAAEDDFEIHSHTAAMLSLADEATARQWLQHASPRVRLAAIQVLDQLPTATLRLNDLLGPLSDDDAALRGAAIHLLGRHPAWAADTVPWLREQLGQLEKTPSDERSTLKLALAELVIAFQTNAHVRTLVSEQLEPDEHRSPAARQFLLELLASLDQLPTEAAWLHAASDALRDARLRAAALQFIATQPQTDWTERLNGVAADPNVPIVERLLAARLAGSASALDAGLLTLAIDSLSSDTDVEQRMQALDLLAEAQLTAAQLPPLVAALPPGSAVSLDPLLPMLKRTANDSVRPALARWFADHLQAGWSPSRDTTLQMLSVFPEPSTARHELLAAWERNESTMLARLDEFLPLLTGGDAQRGRQAFQRATCAGCHRVDQQGGTLGPDLTRVGAIRAGRDLLESILFPSASFAQGFEPYQVSGHDGRQLNGVLVARTPASITLRDAAGTLHRVPASQIASAQRHHLSMMPAGLERLLSREELRDLLAFLLSQK